MRSIAGSTRTLRGPTTLVAEAWAAVLRYTLCRRGVEQMRADADEAARGLAAAGIGAQTVPVGQGIARILCGDLDGGDAFLEDAIGIREEVASPDILVRALCQRSLVAMARNQWSQAEGFASHARSVLHQAGIGKYSLLCAVQARAALHRGDVPAARQELVSAQELRPLLTYAIPHLAIQTRIELIRVHLALADLAGARTLMREVDELLKRRPGMGILVGEAETLRAQLASATRFKRPRSVRLDRDRAARAAAAGHAPVVPGDRRRVDPVAAHHQVADEVHLPQAGRLLPA